MNPYLDNPEINIETISVDTAHQKARDLSGREMNNVRAPSWRMHLYRFENFLERAGIRPTYPTDPQESY